MVSNAVITNDLLEEFRLKFPEHYKCLCSSVDFRDFSDLILFVRKSKSVSTLRSLLFSLFNTLVHLTHDKNYHDAWIVREIIDTLVYTLR